jgi:hypothetical protein
MTIRISTKSAAALRELLRYADPQLVEIFRRAYPYDAEVLDEAPRIATREIVGDVVVH